MKRQQLVNFSQAIGRLTWSGQFSWSDGDAYSGDFCAARIPTKPDTFFRGFRIVLWGPYDSCCEAYGTVPFG